MSHAVGREDLSPLRFERVWVREAVFVDGSESASLPAEALQDLGMSLGIGVQLTEAGDRATVTLSVQVEPAAGPGQFVRLAATVEGSFSIAGGSDRERLAQFAGLQAPVLLLPYARQVITSLTAQSRLGAIVIPPLNMVQVLQEMRERVGQVQTAR